MKKGIHPEYYLEAQVICSCGNTFTTGATQPVIRTDICSACHPFYTGEQRIVDAAGQVERFMRRLEKTESHVSEARARAESQGKQGQRQTTRKSQAGSGGTRKPQAAGDKPRQPRAESGEE